MTYRNRGFTLIELMVTVALVAILAAIALPSYSAYIFRSKVPAGLDALVAYQARMEQAYQDTGFYYVNAANMGVCASSLPSGISNFELTCVVSAAGQTFTATVTGIGPMAGVSYSIDGAGVRTTVTHPKGTPTPNTCWSIRGATCDS